LWVIALGLSACLGKSEAEREAEAMKAASPIRARDDGTIQLSEADRLALDLLVEEAREGELPKISLRYGKARARLGDEALVVSPVVGRIAASPAVALGAEVGAGAAIVEVVPVLAAAERVSLGVQGADLQGQIEVVRRELVQREAAKDRTLELAGTGLATTAKLEEVELALSSAQARLDALQRARAISLRGDGAALSLRAPVAGAVVSLDARVGSVVHEGEVLAVIRRTAALWVDVAMRPDEPVGERYEVLIGEQRVRARLIARGAVVGDDGARLDRLELEAEQPSLLPGASVAVEVARDLTRGVVIPEAAVITGPQGDLVYVEVAPSSFAPERVQVDARFGGKVRLAAGFAPGRSVVVQGAMSLRGESIRADLRQ
jgi:biotin carboxyl carrier protein